MSPVYAEFTAAVAQQIGPRTLQSIASKKRFCGKLRHWCASEGGSGSGRQWRCANCTSRRIAPTHLEAVA